MATYFTEAEWTRLQALFDAAIELDPDERTHYLDKACLGDQSLRSRVDSLIRAFESDTSVGAVLGAVAMEAAVGALPSAGSMLGSYRITQIIGQGGMGIVYRAVRADDEYRLEVAIKVATMCLLSPELRQRFLAERQILANLDHHNIARLLDGGTTPEGIPYVVMELVEGQAIDAYCNQAKLGPRERVELMISVAQAIDYAHRHLVVHRDLKPENVFVTSEGEPKLLDFGIAKALSPEAPGAEPAPKLTQDSARLMTLEYASPEQVLGLTVTTATDVYQLGVLLYLLLSGRLPFPASSFPPGQLEKKICEDTAAKAGVAPDLERILQQAMEKEPGRRYASAGAFAEDLRRYLDGFPVRAQTPSWTYLAGKFVRRHRFGVTAAALLCLLVAGFGVSMALLARRLDRERQQAEVALRRSERVSGLLEDVFAGADPNATSGHNPTARELLDQGTEGVSRTLGNEPEVQASLYTTLGHIYDNLGAIDRAGDLLNRALAIRRQRFGEQSAETADSLTDVADLDIDKGDCAPAEKLVTESLAIRSRLAATVSPGAAEAWNYLGKAQTCLGKLIDAEASFRQSVAVWQRLPTAENADMGMPLHNLSRLLENRGALAEAEDFARRALDVSRSHHGELSPDTAHTLERLGAVLITEGKIGDGLAFLREALDVERKTLNTGNMSIGDTELVLGQALAAEGEATEAEALSRDAVRIEVAALGPSSDRAALAEDSLGQALEKEGNLAEADKTLRAALDAATKSFGERNPARLRFENDLAQVLITEKQLPEAWQLLDQALPLARSSTVGHTLVEAELEHTWGDWLFASRKLAEAEQSYQAALKLDQELLPAGHPDIAADLEALGRLLIAEDRMPQAVAVLKESVRIRALAHSGNPAMLNTAQALLARAERAS